VYLPRNLAANIDALVASGTGQHIEADPALHLTMQGPLSGLGQVRAMGILNGGGAPLKLRTTAGKIRLQYMDSQAALRDSLMREQVDRLNKRFVEVGFPPVSFSFVGAGYDVPPPVERLEPPPKGTGDWIEDWLNELERTFRGSITEDPDDFLRRITYRPNPSYPALAQRAGVHGVVLLQVKVTKDGHVEVQKVLRGEPVLADAAIDAVKRWRARPAWVKGKQCEVTSTVKFDFQLP
jgi:TonB family protein